MTRASMVETIPIRGDTIEVFRWGTGYITISAPDELTPSQARKLAKALGSCADYRCANGYSTKTPHPDSGRRSTGKAAK